jgi:hypothetical protein
MCASSGAIWLSRVRRVDFRVAMATSESVIGVGGVPSFIIGSLWVVE